MYALALAVILVASPYDVAREKAMSTGTPLFIVVSAAWCPSCQVMIKTTIPALAKQGRMRHVVYTVVDVDKNPTVAEKLLKLAESEAIPTLLLFHVQEKRWRYRVHIGAMDAEELQKFLTVRR